jgi:RNA polymerase sigma-70 factor (ECF subfamily)
VGSGDSRVAGLLEQAEASGSVDTLAAQIDQCMENDHLLAQQAIARVQAKVKETTWQAFVLTALEGLSGAEVSARLSIPVAHVYVYKDRVCKLLRQAVDELQSQPPTEEAAP